MSSKKKKILSALLASSMLMSQVSVVAFAATEPMLENFTYTAPTGADEEGNYTYDGTAKEASIVWNGVETSDTITVKYTESSTGENLSTTAPSDAGTYYVYAVVEDGSDYSNTPVQVGSFTISVATPEVADFTFTAPGTNPKYGDAKPTVTSAKNGIGTVSCDYYNAEDEKVTQEKLPVGTYTIKVSTTEATNYSNASDLTNESWTFTVDPAEISKIEISDVAIPTGGSELDTSAADTSASGYTLSTVSWEPSGTAGYNKSYTATVTATPDANHVFKDGGVTITFNSGDATSSQKNEDGSYTITKTFTTEKESVSDVTLTGVDAPVAGANVPTIGVDSGANGKYSIESTTWYTVGAEDTAFNDEKFGANTTYKVVIVLAPGENCKFAGSVNVSGVDGVSPVAPDGESGKVTLTKTFTQTGELTPTYTAPEAKKLTYRGRAQSLVATGSVTGGTFKYRLGETGEFVDEIPTATDAGNYKVYYKIVGDDGYADIDTPDPALIEVTIAQAEVTNFEAPTASRTLNYGDTLSTAGLTSGWTWTDGSTKPGVGNSEYTATYTVSEEDDKNYDYAAFAQANGYTYTGKTLTANVSVTVDKKTLPSLNVEPTGSTPFFYSGEAKTFDSVKISYSDINLTENTDFTIKYENNILVGDNTAKLIISPVESSNYTFEPYTYTFSIYKATPTIYTEYSEQGVLEGSDEFSVPTISVPGTVEYKVDEAKYSESEFRAFLKKQTASEEPITVTCTLIPDDTANYNTHSIEIKFTIVNIVFKIDDNTPVSAENPAVTIDESKLVYGYSWEDILTTNAHIASFGGEVNKTGFTLNISDTIDSAGKHSYEYFFSGQIGETQFNHIVISKGTFDIAPKPITVSAGSTACVSKEYDKTTTANTDICDITNDFTINDLVSGDAGKVSVKVESIGNYNGADVTDSDTVDVVVSLTGEAAGNYTLGENTTVSGVTAKITQRTITPSAEVTGKFNYTGSAPSFTADDIVVTFTDEAIENGAKQTLTFGTDFTVECTSVNAGSATAKIKKVAGSNFTFDDKDVTFTIGAADLSVEYAEEKTAGVASGTYGAKLSELTTFSGLTVKIAGTDTTVKGTWKITGAGSDAIPNVGDDGTYTATFTPDANATNYNTLTAKVTLDISKATLPANLTVADTAVTLSKANTNEQSVKLTLPAVDGIAYKSIAITSDENSIISGNPASYKEDGSVTFTIESGKSKDYTATITVTFTSTNYSDFDVKLVITLSDLLDQAAPDAPTLTSELEAGGNTYKVTITAPDTVDENKTLEYSFDGITFGSKYETTGVAPNTTVTGYIRYAAIQDEANASPAVSATITTPMAASTKPTLPTSEGEFEDSKEITISADEGAKIYYTLDGSTPTENSTLYTAPFTITKTTTVKAIAVNYGKAPSSVVEATYTKKADPVVPVTEYTVTFSNATVKNGTTTLTSGAKVVAGTKLTVTAIPQSGKTATLYINGKAVTGTSTTITVNANVTITVTYTTNSSGNNPGGTGGSGGGSSGGSSSINTSPSVDGKTQTWSDIAKDIAKLPADKTETISLNGNTTVPVDVVKAIATSNAEVTLKVNNVFSWTIDGSEIDPKDAKAADLSITTTTVTGTNVLRGIVGTGFTIKGTNVKSELNINFKATNAGKFANLFKKVDGKLVFVDNVKVDEKGAAIGLEVSEKGEYVVMLGDFSDRSGDMDNDGVMNANDALAVIKDFLEIEAGANPLVADVNHDGRINAKDSLQIIIEFLNLE